MNKLLFTIPLALLLIPFAYAEKAEIDVPFNYHGFSCELVDNTEELTYTCIFQGNIQSFTIEDLKKFEAILTEEEINEAIETIEKLELEKIQEENITENDRLIAHLEKKVYQSQWYDTEELVLLHMLYDLEMCYQGIGRSAIIQDYREFEISNYINYKNNHVEIKAGSKLGELAKNMEECYAQQKLENMVLSQAYANKIHGEKDITFSLLEHYKGLKALPFDELTSTTNEIDMSVICDSNQHSQNYKNLMNCPKPVYDGYTLDKTNGVIIYYSHALEKYQKFMNGYGNKLATSEDKKLEADRASMIVQEMLEENPWYYR